MKIQKMLSMAVFGCALTLTSTAKNAHADELTIDNYSTMQVSYTIVYDETQSGAILQTDTFNESMLDNASYVVISYNMPSTFTASLVEDGLFENTNGPGVTGPTGFGVPGDWDGVGILDGPQGFDGFGSFLYYGPNSPFYGEPANFDPCAEASQGGAIATVVGAIGYALSILPHPGTQTAGKGFIWIGVAIGGGSAGSALLNNCFATNTPQ